MGSIDDFVGLMHNLNRTDLKSSGTFYTWWLKQEGGDIVWSELDIYGILTVFTLVGAITTHFAEPSVSNHAGIELLIEGNIPYRLKSFKFLNV